MVGFSSVVVGLSAAAVAFAAPAPAAEVEERGPMNFTLDPDHPLSKRFNGNLTERSNTNFEQKYVTGGSVNFTPSTNAFSLNWNVNQDFVVGVGWQPGSTAPITHTGSFSVTSGLGSLGLYGWSTNPLVEYYVMEQNVGISTGGTNMGSFTSDGGTYTIWKHQQVNQPSIEGTSTFWQYISIRDSPRTSGTITVQNHFNAWASKGMNLGALNYQVIAVESWSGSGSAQQTVSNTGGSSSGSENTGGGGDSGGAGNGDGGAGNGGGGSGGSCTALYGQCGGIGYSGPTCCASGTCNYSNSYYSQCL